MPTFSIFRSPPKFASSILFIRDRTSPASPNRPEKMYAASAPVIPHMLYPSGQTSYYFTNRLI